MAIKNPPERVLIDKTEIRRALEKSDAETGFQFDPKATPQKSRKLMRDIGISAEDREFIRELLQMRYGSEE